MAENILFTERQRFNQWWLWLLLLVSASFPVFGFIRELQADQPFSNSENNTGIFISLVILVLVIALFFLMRLETRISATGIAVRYFPFHFKFQHFNWEDIEQVYVREYSPISEYGGWGLRFGIFGSGKAYNVSGNQGIQLVFKNGKKLLIGTNKPEAAAQALKQAQPVAG